MPTPRLAVAVLAGVALCPRPAAATDMPDARPEAPAKVSSSAASGSFLSLTQSASIDSHALALGGYDGGRGAGLFEATAEARLWGPIALRGGAVYTGDDRKLRPTIGARVQALREGRDGVDGTIGIAYRPDGLTEPEGEIEAVLAAGVHLGATYLVANLAYGQDAEARERDGELRLAGLRPVTSRLFLGLDGRLRFDLGSKDAGRTEPALDALFGPTAAMVAGPVVLLVHGGASALRVHSAGTYGAFILGGLGTAF